jgi:hypothetical protein
VQHEHTLNSIRACSRTTASTAGAPDCVGTGVKLTKEQRKVLDDSVLSRRPQQGARTDV